MEIHIDILTPKQVMMFKPLIKILREKGHHLRITSRDYHELNQMLEFHDLETIVIGKHGGESLYSKLVNSARRIEELSNYIHEYDPDLCLTHGSPETSRVALGLGIPNININDSPHSIFVSKLTIPLCDKLLTPEMIPVNAWIRYGISRESIVRYKALDPWAWLKDFGPDPSIKKELGIEEDKPLVTFRLLETKASYAKGVSSPVLPAVHQLLEKRKDINVILLPRYKEQVRFLLSEFNNKVKVITEAFNGPNLLNASTVFVGAGGTMTAEAALLGVPAISAHPKNRLYGHLWLESKGLLKLANTPKEIVKKIKEYLNNNSKREKHENRALEITSDFKDPIEVIIAETERFEK